MVAPSILPTTFEPTAGSLTGPTDPVSNIVVGVIAGLLALISVGSILVRNCLRVRRETQDREMQRTAAVNEAVDGAGDEENLEEIPMAVYAEHDMNYSSEKPS